jgi:cytochrome c oxidase subunit 2
MDDLPENLLRCRTMLGHFNVLSLLQLARLLWVLFFWYPLQVFGDSAVLPTPWQMGLMTPASPVMAEIKWFHDHVMYVVVAIAIIVTFLVSYVVYRFRAKRNPVPSKTAHHTWLEVVWTAIPALIVIVLAIPSIKLLYFMDQVPKSDLTIKAIGHQWYWSYEYPDDKMVFDSYMIEDKDLKPGQVRLLEVDNRIVVPINTTIKVLLTSTDVIHSWAVPALGIKTDCVPGRLNETWMRIDKPGIYYGQCSELCGSKHGFMPIVIEAVPPEQYQVWRETAKKKFAAA